MCLGVPMSIVEGDDISALCQRGDEQRRVSLLLVGAQPVGTQVLVHIDTAVRVLDADEAAFDRPGPGRTRRRDARRGFRIRLRRSGRSGATIARAFALTAGNRLIRCCKHSFHIMAALWSAPDENLPFPGSFAGAQIGAVLAKSLPFLRKVENESKRTGNAMTFPFLDALIQRAGLPLVDETNIDAFLAPAEGECRHALLFFRAPRAAPREFGCRRRAAGNSARFRGAPARRDGRAGGRSRAERPLPGVRLAVARVTRGTEPVAVMPKILDWAEYMQKIEASLDPQRPS